jgi:hypothetical protein
MQGCSGRRSFAPFENGDGRFTASATSREHGSRDSHLLPLGLRSFLFRELPSGEMAYGTTLGLLTLTKSSGRQTRFRHLP